MYNECNPVSGLNILNVNTRFPLSLTYKYHRRSNDVGCVINKNLKPGSMDNYTEPVISIARCWLINFT